MAIDRRIRFGLRLKLFLLVLISFSVLISVIAWRVGVESSQAAEKSILKSLSQSEVILETSLNTRFTTILETTRGISIDPRVVPLVVDRDQASLQDFIGEMTEDAELDIIFLTDQNGVILARSDKPSMAGRHLKGKSQLVDDPLAGKEARGFMVSGGDLYQVTSLPIYDNVATSIIRGMVAVAYKLSPDIAMSINKLTENQIGFYAFNKRPNQAPNLERRFMTDFAEKMALDKILSDMALLPKLQQNDTHKVSFLLG
ncbi:MAG: hypothetical protein HOM11_04345 [Methylococcales bacterium]|jgi:sensor histidine kinase regulating citrate/malate metabolism|nr:hypothetical protein [Methylococcales bacterium]MBT7445311.1 hypothetical protein [Methylococcales bacterium]